jgi:hypothetical protein
MISFVTHVRDQPLILNEHLKIWDSFPDEILSRLEFVLIDDFSNPRVMPFVSRMRPYLTLLRSFDSMPWNYGIKNLGAQEAKYDWILETTVDHILTQKAAEQILELPLERGKYYRFMRCNPDEGADPRYSDRPHLATLLVNRDDLFSLGGFDEDFSGHYGHEDGFLKHCLHRRGIEEILCQDIVMRNHSGSTTISDADFLTSGWERDLDRNNALFEKKKAGEPCASSPIVRFAWERVR